jgi:hypothetical protein
MALFGAEGGRRGWDFTGDELDVRRKESSFHIHLILIPLTEDPCLIQKGGSLGSVMIRKPIWGGVQ